MRKTLGSAYARGDIFWIAYPNPDKTPGAKKTIAGPTPFRISELGEAVAEASARKMLDGILSDIANGIAPPDHGPMTLAKWMERRIATRERGRQEWLAMKKHAAMLMPLPLTEIRTLVIGKWLATMHGAPRSVWHRWSNLRVALRDAVIAGLLDSVPMVPPDALPAKVDADPEWRESAIFTMAECERLMTDERIDLRRRVLYALKTLTGMRHGEAVGLRWDRIDWEALPRPKIIVSRQYTGRRTKTLATKTVPLHPALESILSTWRAFVVARDGTEPAADALILADTGGRPLPSHVANPDLQADLRLLGMRPRNGHDFRATFVTTLLESCAKAGIPEFVAKSITHPPSVVRNAYDGYKRVPFPRQCEAMATLTIRSLRIVQDRMVASAGSLEQLQPHYSVSNVSESSANSTDDHKTVLGSSNYQESSRSSGSAHLRLVSPAADAPESSEVRSDRSAVVATLPADARLDALEAAARALLSAVEAFRK